MVGHYQNAAVPRERDDETGRFKKSYTPEKVLDAIEEHDGIAATAEVEEALGCSRRVALNLLHELEDEGRVNAREVSNTYLWSIEDED